jgi:hypothetical protein
MAADSKKIGENRESSVLLVLTQTMLTDILINEGITPSNARALSHRICMALPDHMSLMHRIETSVIDQLVSVLEVEIVNEVMMKARQGRVQRIGTDFGDIESELFDRIEQKARSLMDSDEDPHLDKSRNFELSILRANSPERLGKNKPVLILTSEIRE